MPLTDLDKLEIRAAAEIAQVLMEHIEQAPNAQIGSVLAVKNKVVLTDGAGDGFTLTVQRFVNHETES